MQLQQQQELGAGRELRAVAEPALQEIGVIQQCLDETIAVRRHLARVESWRPGAVGGGRLAPGQTGQRLPLARPQGLHALDLLAENIRRLVEHGEQGITIGRHKHVERPAALPLGALGKLNQTRVERRFQFAIDLDRNEVAIDVGGDGGILVALALHHVTPVAAEVADRDEQQLALAPRAGNGRRSPVLPGDRVVAVHGEIGRGMVLQAVG